VSLRDAWDEQAENWAAWARTPGHDHFYWRYNLPRFLELVPPPGRLTLDLGCGEGRMGRTLMDAGHRVVAVDASSRLCRLTANHAQSQPVVRADMAALPVRDVAADLAIAFMTLQDVDDMQGAVREAGRMLEVGGRLCVAIVHPLNTAGRFAGDDADSLFTITGSYMDRAAFVDVLDRDGINMVFHGEHRPLEVYIAALQQAGFLVEVLREPVPDGDHVRDEPPVARWQRVPTFLHLRAVKSG
jgi:SAM-dependent methyltransferase